MFIEITTVQQHNVLINVTKITDVYCTKNGTALISLDRCREGDIEYDYEALNYGEVIDKLSLFRGDLA